MKVATAKSDSVKKEINKFLYFYRFLATVYMRSLSKDAEIMNAATHIVTFLGSKFPNEYIQKVKEINKMKEEKAILKLQKEELEK